MTNIFAQGSALSPWNQIDPPGNQRGKSQVRGISMQQGKMVLPPGKMTGQQGKTLLQPGKMTVQQGKTLLQPGKMTVQQGKMVLQQNKMAVQLS